MSSPSPRARRPSHPAFAGALALLGLTACTTVSTDSEYFGAVRPPDGQELRYVSGSEPQTLDPHLGTGQPEARIYMALYDGLVEYHPQTLEPIPAVAERWEVNANSTEFLFHLRRGLRWSNGDPLTAHDFVYSYRRGLTPELAALNAYLAYYIRYAQAFNEARVFARDPATGGFVLEPGAEARPRVDRPSDEDSAFRRDILGPTRLTLPGDEATRQARLAADPELARLVAGMDFVPVRGEDIGVEAVDDHTLRLTLEQPAPFFLGLLAHQFFYPVPRQVVEAYGDAWTQPAHIVTNGEFKVETWQPYNRLVVVRDPLYWDADRVRLDRITFYPLEDSTTIMNLYKAGAIDAFLNHTVPAGWLDVIQPMRDYMDAPENATEYYMLNVTRPPMDDVRVRRAFSLAIDRVALSRFRRVTKPSTAFTPEGIYPGYPQPPGAAFDAERARQLLVDAGYAGPDGAYDPATFPIGEVELLYNTNDNNRQVAEFVQAQWRQNLGLTVTLRNMEWQTYLATRAEVEYKGIARAGWVGDYMDPFSFLSVLYADGGNNGTGWYDEEYVALLDRANRASDPDERYRLMAEAEARMLEAQPVIPLYTAGTNWMKKPYVKGMYPNPSTLHPWKYVYIEHDPSKWDRGVPSLVD